MRGAEPDQKDGCDVIPGDPRHDPGRDGCGGQRVVESRVGAQRQAPPLGVAVDRGGEAEQKNAENDAQGASQRREAKREWRHHQNGGGGHLECGVHVDGDCPEQSHREIQGTNVCALRV
jgi:hypothetical protein